MEIEIINLISNMGFPIAAYLLLHFKLGKQIDKNTAAIEQLAEYFKKCQK